MGRKTIVYATQDKVVKLNKKNVDIIKKYFAFKGMNLSDTTKKSYQSDFNQWLVYLLDNYENQYILDILEMENGTEEMVDILEDYFAFCTSVLGNNERRLQRRMSSISSFFLYLRKKRKIKENPIEFLDRPSLKAGEKPQIVQTFLTEDQMFKIKNELAKLGNLQLQMYFEVALTTMGRNNAISNISLKQIDFEEGTINRVIEKEGYEVTLYPSSEALDLIKKWIDHREENNIKNDYLFITRYGGEWKKVDKSTIQGTWIKKIGSLINIPELHTHDLRHSYASYIYNKGMKLEDVQDLLHHRSPEVTLNHYIQKDKSKVKDNKMKFELK